MRPNLASRQGLRMMLVAASLAASGLALAAETPTTTPAAPQAPATEPAPLPPPPAVRDFATAHPQCAEISDSCIVCKVEGDAINCSTPAIACIKGELVCAKEKGTP